MPRRGNNIYKRADGRWEGRILKPNVLQGESRYKYVYGKTYGEVKSKMEAARQNIAKGTFKCDLTLEEGINLWIHEKKNHWKSTTYAAYSNLTRKYIIPILGKCKISQINNRMIESFADRIKDNETGKKLSDGYLRNICSIIVMVLNHMRKKHHFVVDMPDNPVSLSKRKIILLPGERELEILERYLRQNISENGTELGILVSLYTGIRIGELCALKWENIDLANETIYIVRTMQRMKNPCPSDERTSVVFQEPKTITSNREIPIPAVLLPILRKEKRPDCEYLVKGKKKNYAEPRTVEYRFNRILEMCFLKKFHFHMLRHTFASRCISMGFDVKSVSEILGHSNIQTTLNLYVHSSKIRKKQLMDMLRFPEQEKRASSF